MLYLPAYRQLQTTSSGFWGPTLAPHLLYVLPSQAAFYGGIPVGLFPSRAECAHRHTLDLLPPTPSSQDFIDISRNTNQPCCRWAHRWIKTVLG